MEREVHPVVKRYGEQLQAVTDAAENIGITVDDLSAIWGGVPYSLIAKRLDVETLELIIKGFHYLDGLNDEGNLKQLKNNVQIALWKKTGVNWKSHKSNKSWPVS